MNILIVVTNQKLAENYRRWLAVGRQHELTFCHSKAEALAALHDHRHDAVIVHGDATDADGPSVTAALKLRDGSRRTVGFCPTSHAGRRREWELAGADAVIGPELDLQTLLKALGAFAKQP